MPPARHLSLERTVGYIGLFCSVLIIATAIALAVKERQRLYKAAEEQTKTAAFFLSDHASRLFEASDLLLTETTGLIGEMSWDEIATSRTLWDKLAELGERLPYVEAIWLNDDRGELRLSTIRFPSPRSNVFDRDFFAAHRNPSSGLFVGGVVQGRVTGRPTFLLSRRLNAVDGGMQGIAAVTADLGYFNEFYGSLKLPFSPTVTLFRSADMHVLASHPSRSGQLIRAATEIAAAIARDPAAGIIIMAGAAEGATSTVAYQKAGGLPVYVAAAIPHENLERVWRQTLATYGLLGGIALLALGGLTLFAFRQARRIAHVQHDLEGRVQQRTADLGAANAELGTLFQEVHHRVKNNLQVVTSLLRLQQMRVEAPQARAALQDSIDRIHAMGLVHQLLYSKQELSSVDFAEYGTTLAGQLVGAYGMADRIAVVVSGDPVRFDLDTTIPIALIVNETVSNALKHAFPQDARGRIDIAVHRDGDDIVLTVRDDGKGMPEGADWRTLPSLGLRIVRSLSAQLGGEADFATDNGTRFTLRFPEKRDA